MSTTPYDLVFRTAEFEQGAFPRIRNEATQLQADVRSAADFVRLESVGALLRDLMPEEATGPAAAPGRQPSGASAIAIERYGALLFHAYRFWLHDRVVHRFDLETARPLFSHDFPSFMATPVPADAGYVQLPRNLLWARIAQDETPEPVDGFFYSTALQDDGIARLDVLLALGVRPGRPGFSVIESASDNAGATLQRSLEEPARIDGHDFANVLPGGELQHLHAVTTEAEVMKLAARCFGAIAEASPVRSEDGTYRIRKQDG